MGTNTRTIKLSLKTLLRSEVRKRREGIVTGRFLIDILKEETTILTW